VPHQDFPELTTAEADVRIFAGHCEIVAAEAPGAAVTIDPMNPASVADRAAAAATTVRRSGNRVSVRVPRGSDPGAVRMALRLPTGASAEVTTVSAAVQVSGVLRELKADGTCAPLDVDTVTGELSVTTVSGPVHVGSVGGEVRVST
jgi:hypothetical protein